MKRFLKMKIVLLKTRICLFNNCLFPNFLLKIHADKLVLNFIFVFCGFLITSCASNTTRDVNTAQGAYEDALDYEKEERFDEAIRHLNEVKNKFPYSSYATLSELKIADIHYQKSSFLEAQHAYEIFKDFHPKHPKSDYVTYQIGMSYFKQLPETTDRDLSAAQKVITTFDTLKQFYPNSSYIKEAELRKNEAFKMLAEKELYIAQFYFKQQNYTSAIGRFDNLYKNFKSLGYGPQALYHAALSAYRSDKKQKGDDYARLLKSEYPTSAEAKSELK